MQPAAKVFVVHPVKEDISPADQFGEVIFVNQRYIYGDEIKDDQTPPAGFMANVISAAARFRPDYDYLLLAGDHLQIVLLCAEIVNEHLQPFRVLRYDRVAKGYFPVMVMGHT